MTTNKDRFSEMMKLKAKTKDPYAQEKFNEWYNSLEESEKLAFDKYNKKWTIICIGVIAFIFLALIGSCFGGGDKKKDANPQATQTQQVEKSEAEKQLDVVKSKTRIKDLMNGANTKAIGLFSETEMTSSEFDSLKEVWYFNWAKKNVDSHDWNYAVVVFTDKPGYGAAYNGVLQVNCPLEKDKKNGSYSIGNGDIYVEDNGHLKRFSNVSQADVEAKKKEIAQKVQSIVPEAKNLSISQMTDDSFSISFDINTQVSKEEAKALGKEKLQTLIGTDVGAKIDAYSVIMIGKEANVMVNYSSENGAFSAMAGGKREPI